MRTSGSALDWGVGIMRGEVLHYDEARASASSRLGRQSLHVQARGSEAGVPDYRRVRCRVPGESAGRRATSFRSATKLQSLLPQRRPQRQRLLRPQRLAPQHFGRFAVSGSPASTGLWSYFWEGITSNYANFRGRARRKEYWGFYLFWAIWLIAPRAALILDLDAAHGQLDDSDRGTDIWPLRSRAVLSRHHPALHRHDRPTLS